MEMTKRMRVGIVVIVLFSFIFSANYLAFAEKLYTISGNSYIGCTSKKYYNKLLDYAVQHDEVAFKRALTAGVLAGICTMFKYGEKVYITDTSIFSGSVKVRRPGETIEYWTAIEAVK